MEEVLKSLGGMGIFLGFMFTSIGFPVPLPLLLGLIYALKQSYGISLAMAGFLVFAGNMTGDMTAFLIFRHGGHPLLTRLLNRRQGYSGTFAKIERFYDRYGALSLILFRWIPWGKAQVVWLCGTCKVGAIGFFTKLIVAELPWAYFWVFLVFRFSEFINHLLP